MNSILWREIRQGHERARPKLPGRITADARWLTGNTLTAYGRKPADNDPDAFQGIHAEYILIIIDEANGVHPLIWQAVETLATNKNARVLAIGNPDDPTSTFHSITQPPTHWKVIHIDGLRTPNFTAEGQQLSPQTRSKLLSRTWVEERKAAWGEDSPLYQSKVRGRFPSISDFALLNASDLAQTNTTDPLTQRQRTIHALTAHPHTAILSNLGVDVARYGDDSTTIYRARTYPGLTQYELTHLTSRNGNDTFETTELVKSFLTPTQHPGQSPPEANIDEVGAGAGVLDNLIHENLPVHGFSAATQSTDPQRYANLRAEAYWNLRTLFKDKKIILDDLIPEELIVELTSIRWKINPRGRIQIESKEEYKTRTNRHSPDHADAAVLALWQATLAPASLIDEILSQHTQPQSTSAAPVPALTSGIYTPSKDLYKPDNLLLTHGLMSAPV